MADFHFKTRHALSILVILLIIIFLFQPSIFGTMINTHLGRFTLLFILILLTGYHKFYGLISVLLIIAIYEYYNTFEGFEKLDTKNTDLYTNKYEKEDKGNNSYTKVPPNQHHSLLADTTNAMTQAKKTTIESQLLKKNKSSELPSYKHGYSTTHVLPSETIIKKKNSIDGFTHL